MRVNLSSSNRQLRQTTVAALGRMDTPDVIPVLRLALTDSSYAVRQSAVISLGARIDKQPSIINDLNPLLNDNYWQVRQSTAFALRGAQTQQALTPLRTLMQDSNPFVRSTAVESFAQIPKAPLMELEPFLNDPNLRVQFSATQSLGARLTDFPQLTDTFINLTKESFHPLVRCTAISSLGNANSPKAIATVEQGLSSEDWRLRQSANLALGRIDSPKAIDSLRASLNDPHPLVRITALASLGNKIEKYPANIDDVAGLTNDFVRLVREDPNLLVRSLATLTLALDDANKFNVTDVIKDNIVSSNWQLRQSAVTALGRIDTPDAIEPLISAVDDDNYLVGSIAQHSLRTKVKQHPELANLSGTTRRFFDNLKEESDDSPETQSRTTLEYKDFSYYFWKHFWLWLYTDSPTTGISVSAFGFSRSITTAGDSVSVSPGTLIGASLDFQSWNPKTNLELFAGSNNVGVGVYALEEGIKPFAVHIGGSFPSLPVNASVKLFGSDGKKNDSDYPSKRFFANPFKPELSSLPRVNFFTDVNTWSNKAIPPGGTSFNPSYMSTSPLGIEQSIRSTMPIPSHITTFDPRYMSTPPPGSVYFGPQVTGGNAYTGGEYIPSTPNFRDPFQSQLPIDNSSYPIGPAPDIRAPSASGGGIHVERIPPPQGIK